MESQYLVKAINKLCPGAEFSFTNDDYSTIQWVVLEGKAPTAAQITKAIEEIKAAEATATQDAEARKAALLARLGITEEELKTLLG